MGLDMYLYKKNYVQNWDHMSDDEKHSISIKKGGKKRSDIKPERICYVIEQVGYWRKFNALHNWFVQNCGDGVDNCQEMYVSKREIEKLLVDLITVRNALDKAPTKIVKVHVGWTNGEKMYEDSEVYEIVPEVKELLPPTDGFFFGSTNVDKYYYQDLVETIDLFKGLMKENPDGEYYYQASW